jgi:hypothetical protein
MNHVSCARARRFAGTLVFAIAAIAACSRAQPGGPGAPSGQGPVPLNGVTASQLIASFTKAGLPAVNSHDVTGEQCPKSHCVQAVGTDTVSVYKFPTTGLAQKYAGSISDVYQVEDLVLVFAPSVTDDLKRDYEEVVERAAA